MKSIYLSIFLFFIFQSTLFANGKLLEFRLAFENERSNTEVVIDKDVGKLFVENAPFLTISDISEANLIIDNSKPSAWLERSVKSTGGKIIRPHIKLEFILKESGRKIIRQVTSENKGKRTAIFINGKYVAAPSIIEKIDSDRFFILTSYNENEAREIVDFINKNLTTQDKT